GVAGTANADVHLSVRAKGNGSVWMLSPIWKCGIKYVDLSQGAVRQYGSGVDFFDRDDIQFAFVDGKAMGLLNIGYHFGSVSRSVAIGVLQEGHCARLPVRKI